MSLLDRLADLNPEALLLEPRDVLDSCVVDITNQPTGHWAEQRQTPAWVAVYSVERCIAAIVSSTPGSTWEGAAEYLSFNAIDAWMGEGTPTFVWDDDLFEE